MALLFWEGFDSFSSQTQLNGNIPGWNMSWDRTDLAAATHMNVSAGNGRYGGQSLSPGTQSAAWGKITFNSSASNEIYTGRAINVTNINSLICFWGNSTLTAGYTSPPAPDVWVEFAGSGILRAYNFQGATHTNSITVGGGKSLIGTTDIGVIRSGIYQWLEVRVKASSSNTTADGIVEVWVEGVKVISNTSCVTLANNSSTGYNGVNTNIPRDRYWSGMDDYYITDTTGSAPWNGRLGDVRVANIVPSSDVPGANSGTPSTGTAHWSTVDELPFNTSDYVYIPNSSGNLERFNRTSLPTLPNTILAIAPSLWVLKSDAGTANLHNILYNNSSGYQVNGNTVSISTSYARYRDSYITNPETGLQWTNANVANLQLGLVIDP